MPDQITRTTTTSWFSRIGSALAGVLVGLVLILGCVAGLAWNEGNAVKIARGLTEGAGTVIEAEVAPILPANDQKLVHVTGVVGVTEPLSDPEFGITATGVKLARTVEMYQWQEESKSETRTKLGGGEETITTYTYSKVWSSDAIDSSNFQTVAGHENPQMTIEPREVYAQDATLGDFRLDDTVLSQMGGAQALPLPPAMLPEVEAAAGQGRTLSLGQNRIYLGENPAAPAIGDTRIAYDLTPAAETSVVARQNGDGFMPWRARNGAEVLLVEDGNVPAADMFQSAQDANTVLAWIIRVGGVILLMVGFGLILAPFGVLADVLPLAGTIVRMGTGLIGFVLGLLVGTVTIALAWLAFRPVTTVIILLVGGGIAFAVYRLGLGRAKRAAAAGAST
ncbi:MAG: TMEM43 family protein [Brevundimonas sp.]|uniref:TMEM43 family protein n=1 Tax=Brevundimonas sp. TaxID=1871086 RepID=UPI002736BA73|nr:TMEM43 family protein [Brevundimonas sp.]MDP3406480.1 TMEM43 family protein [Brevundimonas sp.]